jgi:hypothetical protein
MSYCNIEFRGPVAGLQQRTYPLLVLISPLAVNYSATEVKSLLTCSVALRCIPPFRRFRRIISKHYRVGDDPEWHAALSYAQYRIRELQRKSQQYGSDDERGNRDRYRCERRPLLAQDPKARDRRRRARAPGLRPQPTDLDPTISRGGATDLSMHDFGPVCDGALARLA